MGVKNKKGVKQKKKKSSKHQKQVSNKKKNNKRNAPLKLSFAVDVAIRRYCASWLMCCPRVRRYRSSSLCCWSSAGVGVVCITFAVAAIHRRCAAGHAGDFSVRALFCGCLLLWAALLQQNIGQGWVGSAQHLSPKKQKKALLCHFRNSAMASSYATRNATSIWWRFFKIPRCHSAMAAT